MFYVVSMCVLCGFELGFSLFLCGFSLGRMRVLVGFYLGFYSGVVFDLFYVVSVVLLLMFLRVLVGFFMLGSFGF